METEIELGDEVRCIYTGLKGVVMDRTEFMNGCVQFGIVQKHDPKLPLEQSMAEANIDSQSLVIVKKGARHKAKDKEKEPVDFSEDVGGRTRVMRRRM